MNEDSLCKSPLHSGPLHLYVGEFVTLSYVYCGAFILFASRHCTAVLCIYMWESSWLFHMFIVALLLSLQVATAQQSFAFVCGRVRDSFTCLLWRLYSLCKSPLHSGSGAVHSQRSGSTHNGLILVLISWLFRRCVIQFVPHFYKSQVATALTTAQRQERCVVATCDLKTWLAVRFVLPHTNACICEGIRDLRTCGSSWHLRVP